jgi:hypothetical protein
MLPNAWGFMGILQGPGWDSHTSPLTHLGHEKQGEQSHKAEHQLPGGDKWSNGRPPVTPGDPPQV